MKENVLSYREILDYFGEAKITDRYKFLYDKMQAYIKEREQTEKLTVNEAVLQQVVMDYFADIYRLKEFHKIDKVDLAKILSYETYWILRRKPLQLLPGADESRLVFANEGFLTTFLAHEFLWPDEAEPMNSGAEDAFVRYLQHIYYYLKYRAVDQQSLETMLYSYEIGKQMR